MNYYLYLFYFIIAISSFCAGVIYENIAVSAQIEQNIINSYEKWPHTIHVQGMEFKLEKVNKSFGISWKP